MLVPDLHFAVQCFSLLSVDVHWILVKKKLNDTCIHTHTVFVSALSLVERVEKKASATPKRAKKNKANQKSNGIQLHFCGNSKTDSST
jgi:hypothetical protein